MGNDVTYTPGFSENLRADAAALYDQAFGAKLALAIPSREARIGLLTQCLQPNYALVVLANAELVGLAGFHTPDGSLTGGMTWRTIRAQVGVIRGLWAVCVFSLFARRLEPGVLLMDGIAVRDDMRGHGIGSQLLDHLAHYAREHGYTRIRLDVIETNHAARRLYERKGFRAVHTDNFPYLKWLLGFGAATKMELRVVPDAQLGSQ